jgi:hypothetical protein
MPKSRAITITIILLVVAVVAIIVVVIINQKSTNNNVSTVPTAPSGAKSTSMSKEPPQVSLKTTTTKKFPYYWLRVESGTGYAMEVYLNGEKVYSSSGISNSSVTSDKAQSLLVNGKNEIWVAIKSIDSKQSTYYRKAWVLLWGSEYPDSPTMDQATEIIEPIHLVAEDITEPKIFNYSFNFKR